MKHSSFAMIKVALLIIHYFIFFLMIVSILIIARETVDGLAASCIGRGDNDTHSHHLQAEPKSLFFRLTKETLL